MLPPSSAHASPGVTPVSGSSLVLHLDAGDTDSYPGSGTTWTDLSASGNDATLRGSPVATFSSDDGGYLEFPGGGLDGDAGDSATYVEIPDSTELDRIHTAVTVEMWLWLDTAPGSSPMMLFSKREYNQVGSGFVGYVGFVTSAGWTFRFGSSASLTHAGDLGTGVWRQVVAVVETDALKDGLGGRVYVDGALRASDPAYGGDADLTRTGAALDLFNVNPRPQTGPVALDGRVAIVRMYSVALTGEQVARNYTAERERFGLPVLS